MEQFKRFILARLAQSVESIQDANLLLNAGSYCSSINRSYYAMYYSLQALLYLTTSTSSSHKGTIGIFDKEFVKEGKFPKEMSKDIHKAFKIRNFTDYHELNKIDKSLAEEILKKATNFNNSINKFFKENYELFLS